MPSSDSDASREPQGVSPAESPAGEATEEREVRVVDPHLSANANELLTDEVQAIIGADHVTVTKRRAHPSRGDRDRSRHLPAMGNSLNFILMVMALLFIVVGALLTALTGSWWFAGLAFVTDAVAGGLVIFFVLQMTQVPEHADANTVALLEEEGVENPDRLLSDLVSEFTEAHRTDDSDTTHRPTAVEDDPVKASAEQTGAGTPTGGRSRAVGPGSEP